MPGLPCQGLSVVSAPPDVGNELLQRLCQNSSTPSHQESKSMKEFIRQFRLWRVRRKITQAIRRIQQAQQMPESCDTLRNVEQRLRIARRAHNP